MAEKAKPTNQNNKNNQYAAIEKKNKKRKTQKIVKAVIISVIAVVAVILCVVFFSNMSKSDETPTSVVTYNVQAVTTGDVSTTISGSGTLSPVTQENLQTTTAVTVTEVNYVVGDTVEADAVIASATDAEGNVTDFTAPYECVLLELPIAVDDELAAASQIAMIMGTDGFTMGIAVDELDIATVEVGQEVTFTVDAVSGEYTGTVSAVSYNGSSSSGSTAYQITAKMDYVEGIYPGMSVSAEIVIESSGEGLLVPVDAVYTSGDDNYIYLAPSGAAEGTEYSEAELDVSTLTKVNVETGMSDGSYILVESEEIADGTLIVIEKITSTQTGSESDENAGFGGMGMGGNFPGGGGGMDFGDFDFENFDPGNMPQGGGGFPGMGAN